VPKSGLPVMNDLVPSIGSSTLHYALYLVYDDMQLQIKKEDCWQAH